MTSDKNRINVLILAAGFGTRLGQFGENTPKGLVKIGGEQTILGKLLNDIKKLSEMKRIYLVTNKRFEGMYKKWLNDNNYKGEVEIFSNGVAVPEKRNGALKDLFLSISHFKLDGLDLLVCPSDTYYDFSFPDFVDYCRENRSKFITIFRKMRSLEEIKNRLGCAVLDGDRVVSFEEKPENPKSPYAVIPFYFYPKIYLKYLKDYIRQGNNPDAPSNIISWFLKSKIEVNAYIVFGNTLDVGTVADIEKLQNLKS